jgi:hypothetical protein
MFSVFQADPIKVGFNQEEQLLNELIVEIRFFYVVQIYAPDSPDGVVRRNRRNFRNA